MLESEGGWLPGEISVEAAAGAQSGVRASGRREGVQSALKTKVLSVGKDDFCLL